MPMFWANLAERRTLTGVSRCRIVIACIEDQGRDPYHGFWAGSVERRDP
jgi:hypothetical protein